MPHSLNKKLNLAWKLAEVEFLLIELEEVKKYVDNVRKEEEESKGETGEDAIDIQDINLQENKGERIVFRKLPLWIWLFGGAIAVVGIYLLLHLALANVAPDFKKFNEGYWWQYLILVLIFII